MSGYIQTIIPNPNVLCTPGLCLVYVQDAAGITQQHLEDIGMLKPSATAAWNASPTQHKDQDFPEGCWVPIWFSLATNVNGHVAWRAPDGSVWSASHPTSNQPVHHASITALINYYAKANPLTYLGWTEDIEGVIVIKKGENMPELVNLDTARILANGCGISDGFDGRPAAHGGQRDDDLNKNHVGKELTNEYIINNWWKSQEASDKLGITRAVYAERDALRAKVVNIASNPGTDSDKKLQAIKDALGIK